jgi:hypothetical protein
MESAVRGVILDSSVVIEAERQQLNIAQFLKQIVRKIGEREVGSEPSPLPNWCMGSTGRVVAAHALQTSRQDC